jgi:hypothetical protein
VNVKWGSRSPGGVQRYSDRLAPSSRRKFSGPFANANHVRAFAQYEQLQRFDPLPIVVQIGAWGSRFVPDAKKLDAVARKYVRAIQEGGPRLWAKRTDELRAEHLP